MGCHRTSVTSPRSCTRVRVGDREREYQPVRLIDIGTALDLLSGAVHQRGAGFVRGPGWVNESRHPTYRYTHHGAQDCIVGHVLAHAGVSVRVLEAMRDDSVDDLYRKGRFPVHLTLGALAVLRAAQQSQDRGCRWGDVLTQATAVCVRVLDVAPDAAFEFAAQLPRTLAGATPDPRLSETDGTYRLNRGMGMSNGTSDKR